MLGCTPLNYLDFTMRMPRVYTYFDKSGRGHHNIDRLLIPFRLMKNIGDFCEVEEGPTCVAGNVATLCSMWSHKLGRRFSFRDLNNGTYRITVMAEPVRPPKQGTVKPSGSRKVPHSVPR